MLPFLMTIGFNFLQDILADNPPEIGGFSVFLIAIGFAAMIYILVSFAWAYHFIIFYKMDFWPALDTSRRLISKRWFPVFLMYIVFGLVAMLGVIAFIIGMMVTIPVMYAAEYAAFADVTGLMEEQNMESDIVDHLVD